MFKNNFFSKKKNDKSMPVKKLFKMRGDKGGMKSSSHSSMKSSSISPSVGEFDDMMSKMSGKENSKKSMFTKKK